MLGWIGRWAASKGMVAVPNLIGLLNTAAQTAIANSGLTYSSSSTTDTGDSGLANKVASQTPTSGTLADYESSVSFVYYNYVPVGPFFPPFFPFFPPFFPPSFPFFPPSFPFFPPSFPFFPPFFPPSFPFFPPSFPFFPPSFPFFPPSFPFFPPSFPSFTPVDCGTFYGTSEIMVADPDCASGYRYYTEYAYSNSDCDYRIAGECVYSAPSFPFFPPSFPFFPPSFPSTPVLINTTYGDCTVYSPCPGGGEQLVVREYSDGSFTYDYECCTISSPAPSFPFFPPSFPFFPPSFPSFTTPSFPFFPPSFPFFPPSFPSFTTPSFPFFPPSFPFFPPSFPSFTPACTVGGDCGSYCDFMDATYYYYRYDASCNCVWSGYDFC